MKHTYGIVYENITLRPLVKDDIELLRQWRNNPNNSLFLTKLPFITKEMQKKWFDSYLCNNDEICFAICENKKLNRFVGSLSLYQFNVDYCYFGKLLIGDDDAHGKKVGQNATIAATIIAFNQFNLKKVFLYVYKDNIAAFNVYKNAGFDIIDVRLDESGREEYIMRKDSSRR